EVLRPREVQPGAHGLLRRPRRGRDRGQERQPLQRAVPDHDVLRVQPMGRGGVPGDVLAALVLSRTTTTANEDRSAWVSQRRLPSRSAAIDKRRLRRLRLGPEPGRAAHTAGIAMYRGAERGIDAV